MGHRRAYTVFALAGVSTGSLLVLLGVSVSRQFIPGVVEISVALIACTVALVVSVAAARTWNRVFGWAGQVSPKTLKYSTTAVAILALTAVLAVPFEHFPWPASLLLAVIVGLVGAADAGTERKTGGEPPDELAPAAPSPVPAGSYILARPRRAAAVRLSWVPDWSRCPETSLRARRGDTRPRRRPPVVPAAAAPRSRAAR